MSNVPVYNINKPGGGPQPKAPTVTTNTPVYSSYTGELIGYGPITYGTVNDAPKEHPNYNKSYRVIEYNPCNKTFMAHGMKQSKPRFRCSK